MPDGNEEFKELERRNQLSHGLRMGQVEEILGVASRLKLKKARALFFYLSLPLGRQHRIDKVIDLFWRGGDAVKANASFRQTLRQIRLTVPQGAEITLTSVQGSVCATTASGRSIEEAFRSGLRSPERFAQTTAQMRHVFEALDLLLGLTDSFDSWIQVTIATLTRDALNELTMLIDTAEPGQAIAAAEFALTLEPHNERAVRFLMNEFWTAGAANRAIDLYTDLYRHLDREYDQEPEIETIELLAAIKLSPDGKGRKDPTLPQKISLCVQCNAPVPPEPSVASFLNVVSVDLHKRLAAFREWNVVTDADTPKPLTLSLDLTRGNVLFSLRIELLSNARSEPIWSTSIPDPQKDWVDKVRVFVFELAETLRVVLSDTRHTDLSTGMYDKWLRGLSLKASWHRADEARAVALFEDILADASDFGPAHAELAGIYNITHVLHPGTYQSKEIQAKALSHALEAVRLDPLDTRAHRVLAWCYCHASEFDLAEFHFDQSLSLNPQNVHTIASAALGYAFTGDTARARNQIDALQAAQTSREPFHDIYLAAVHYLLGDYQRAAAFCDGNAGRMPTVGGWHSAALAQTGEHAAARQRFLAFVQEISAQWRGETAATPQQVIDWFTACFPLRHAAARDSLRATLTNLAR